jgi:hypothetical protein
MTTLPACCFSVGPDLNRQYVLIVFFLMVTGFARVVDFATERLLFSFRSQYGNYF